MPAPQEPTWPDAPVVSGLPRFAASRSIAALMLREMSTRFGRTPGGYVWILLQPLGVIVMMAIAFSLLVRNPALGTSFLLFKSTGFLILTMFKTVSQTVGMGLIFSRPLLEYPGVAWIDPLLARFLINGIMGVLVTAVILAGIVLYEDLNPVIDWVRLIETIMLTLLLGFGVGCLNCVLFMRFEVWQTVWSMVTAPLMIISGVFILYEEMPPLAQQLLWWNPVLHLTAMMREGFYSAYNPNFISITYVSACALVPMVLGLVLLRRHHRVLLER